jgi:hypothetical protein
MGVREDNSSTEPALVFNGEGNREQQLVSPPQKLACCQILGLRLARFIIIMSMKLSQHEI